jgi:CubicO group peptidase (beta-lactamase class C family)
VARDDGDIHPAAAKALSAPCLWPHDIRAVIEGETFDPPPWNVVIGPVCDRGDPSGLVLKGDREVARWGDVERADMAFSVAKSYLGLLVAAALDQGLIADLAEPVSMRIDDPAFASPRNRRVTWRQLLDQTSEWGGELFGVPYTADRDRQLAPTESGERMDRGTPLQEPGTYWDYNDIRVNALCLAITRLFGRPLAETLAALHPAFAPETGFLWRGYGARSTIEVGGAPVEVAVGGGHWGGGVVATAAHHLTLGRIALQGGMDGDRRCVGAAALREVLRPCPLQPIYGGLWWLNTGRALYREASPDSVFAMGIGTTVIWVEPALDVVAVARWIRPEAIGGWIAAIRDSVSAT